MRSRPSSFWSKARKLLTAAVILLFFAAIANYAPSLADYSDQDECAFGPVSNEQYRAYLRDVELRQRVRWPPLNSNAQELERQLNMRLRDMVGTESSVYARMAMMHAIVRGIGAYYINTNGNPDEPYKRIRVRAGFIQVAYFIETNQLVWFQLYPRRLSIRASFSDVQATTARNLEDFGRERFLVNSEYHLIGGLPADWSVRSWQSCPAVPPADIAPRYEVRG